MWIDGYGVYDFGIVGLDESGFSLGLNQSYEILALAEMSSMLAREVSIG